jgi:hypothetical protein
MENLFVLYEQAIELKELGFDNPCFGYYGENQKLIWKSGYAPWTNSERNLVDNHFTAAPLKQQVFRWFRDEHNLKFHIRQDNWNNWCSVWILISNEHERVRGYSTYEEAEDACLDRLIQIAKNKP